MGEARFESRPTAENLMPSACAKPNTSEDSIPPRHSPPPMACAASAIKPRPATMSRDHPAA